MISIKQISGVSGGDCFLLISGESAVLVDTGFAFCAHTAAEQIKQYLGSLPLRYILLTHSHYDHLGGSAVIKDHFPEAVLVASDTVDKILQKPNALITMQELDDSYAQTLGMSIAPEAYHKIHLDLTVSDGDKIQWEGSSIRVIATPGHTRCCTSYFFEDLSILAVSETVGTATFFPKICPAFITNYHQAQEAITKCEQLKAETLIISHSHYLTGSDAEIFWELARETAQTAYNFVVDHLKNNLSHEEIVDRYCDLFYDDALAEVQPEKAFLLNANAMVSVIIRDIGNI